MRVWNKKMTKDNRSKELQREFPLREIHLGICICGYGNEDHATDLDHLGVKDVVCEICICNEFKHNLPKGKTKNAS